MKLPATLAVLIAAVLNLALAAPALTPANAAAPALAPAPVAASVTGPLTAPTPARGRFVFDGWAGPPLPVWYQLPRTVTADTPVVVVMHGVNRDADRYRDEWAGLARRHNMIVVVPEFSDAAFPGARGYNTGFLTEADGTPRPPSLWSFAAIEPLFDAVRARFGTQVPRYTIYGHSAGAQFVHRFVMFMPDARLAQAISANAGWYTMPDPAAAFPYGLSGAPLPPAALPRALGQPVVVLLGTADTDPKHPNLRTTPEANRQGPHRFARGQSFLAEGRAAATRLAVPFGWTLQAVPGVSHQNGPMAKAAARLIAARR